MWFVAPVTDLRPGRRILVEPDGETRILVIIADDGTVGAIDEACPHHGAGMANGMVKGRTIECPWHQWRIDIFTGCPSMLGGRDKGYVVELRDDGAWVRPLGTDEARATPVSVGSPDHALARLRARAGGSYSHVHEGP